MPTYDYFLEKETEHYHLVAVGTSPDDAFVTFQSKATGALVPHLSLPLEGGDIGWWSTYLEQAEHLDGEALDRHLSRFIPISRLNDMHITGMDAYRTHTDGATGESYVSLADVLSTDRPAREVALARKAKDAIDVVERYRETQDNPHTSEVATLSNGLSSLSASVEASIPRRQEKTYSYDYITLGKKIDSLGLLKEDVLSHADGVALRELLAALHSMGSSHQMGRRQVELSHGHALPTLGEDHPYHQAIRRMVMGKTSLVPDEALVASGWFGGEDIAGKRTTHYARSGASNVPLYETETSTRFRDYQKGGAALGLTLLASCQSDEEKRNLFQLMQALRFEPGLLRIHKQNDLNPFTTGQPVSQFLWDAQVKAASANDRSIAFERTKLGKKETHLLIHNMEALHRIQHFGFDGEIKTHHGDTLHISPYSREAMLATGESGKPRYREMDPGLVGEEKANAKAQGQYARVTYSDKDGNAVFSGDVDIETFKDIDDPSIALILMDMPPDVMRRPEHLFALQAITVNPSLKSSLAEGALKLRDKQIKRSELYSGAWQSMTSKIDREITQHPKIEGSYMRVKKSLDENKTLEHYQRRTHVADTENMLETVINALKTSYLVEAESPFSDLNDLLEREHDDDKNVIRIYGENFVLDGDDSRRLHEDLFYNAKIDLADKAHKGYSRVRNEASPNVALAWEAALPEITLEVPGQSPITIRNLSSYSDITLEGDAMSHCLGSYASRCIHGEYLAFSVMQDGKRVATLGMESDGESAEFDQLQGYGNGQIDPMLNKVIMEQFVDPLEKDGEVMDEVLEVSTPDAYDNRLTNRQLLSLQMDFELFDEDKLSLCRDYITHLVAPEAVVAMVEREMDRQIDFYENYAFEQDMDGFFSSELSQLEKNRDKLYDDFGLTRQPAPDMTG